MSHVNARLTAQGKVAPYSTRNCVLAAMPHCPSAATELPTDGQ